RACSIPAASARNCVLTCRYVTRHSKCPRLNEPYPQAVGGYLMSNAARSAKVFEPILSLNHQVLMTIGGQLVDSNFRRLPTKETQCDAASSPNTMKKGRFEAALNCGGRI